MKCTIMELITDFTPIEKLLLPNGCCFANDARNVINSWNSNDILACPGSGKTTVLIAKLKLIADKSPLKDGRGVCVLSHTNVAVSELKAKLGKSAERLLSYPNFVGTIQTFVDQYITFPFLRQFANTSIQVVSDEDYANHLYSLICKTDSKLKWFIDQQYNAFGVKRYDSVVKFMANIYTGDEGGIHLSGVNRVLAGKSTNSAISYARAIQRLLSEEGLIRYNDTYRYTLLALKKYLETETKKSSDIRRILPLLERKITQCKNELQEKSRRCIYVGFSRPKYLLCLAISEKTYVGHETAFSSWKIVDLRSEDAM